MGKRIILLLIGNVLLPALLWAQVPGRMVVTSPDGTREVEVSTGQAIYVTCPDGTCAGGGGVSAAVDLTKIGGVVIGGADVVDVPNTAFRVNCVVGCSSSSFTDNSAFTFGTTAINITGFVFDDVAPNAATENRAAAPRMSGNRVPYSILRDGAGNERGVNVTAANALKVDGSGVTQPISGSIGLLNLTQTHNTIPNPTLSLQLGGAETDGGTHRHVGATNGDAPTNSVGLIVRNITAVGTPGNAAPTQFNLVAGRDPVTNAIRQVDSLASAPTGTENGVITRNLPSGTQAVSHANFANLDSALSTLLTTAAFQARINTLGQKTMANSTPVVIASDQTAVAMSSTQLPAALDGAGALKVNLVSPTTVAVTQATASNLNATVAQPTAANLNAAVVGNVGAGTADTGFPVKMGCRARGTVAAVAGDARVDLYCDTFGRPQVTSVPTYVVQTANAPATFSVGVASAQALAANTSRKAVIINNISNAKVCFGIAATAVLDSGICLQPDASLSLMNGAFDGVPTGAINAIAGAAASTISIQEFQ